MSDFLRLGGEWDPESGDVSEPVTFDLAAGHVFLFGPTRCGKGVTIEIPNLLLDLHHTSIISIDPTGQNASVCAEARRRAGSKVLALNPMGLHVNRYPDLASVGCNPMLVGMDPKSPRYLEEAAAICDALAWSDKGDPFWPDSGRDLVTGLLMFVRLRDGDRANLSTVLELLMEGEEFDEDGMPIKGLRATARHMMAGGQWQIKQMAGRFLGEGQEQISKTIESIQQTARTAARSLLSGPVRADLAKNGIDWTDLARQPTTVFIIMTAEDIEFHKVWLRLMVTSALNSIYRLAGNYRVLTLFWLSEFFALGKLGAIAAAMGQAAKYGVRIFAVLQNWPQLIDMFEENGAHNFMSNCACKIAFAPDDNKTARYLSDYSGGEFETRYSASEDETGRINRNYQTVREPLWYPEDIKRVPKNHAFVWFYGEPEPVPVCLAPPYYEDAECKRAGPRADPFHSGGVGADTGGQSSPVLGPIFEKIKETAGRKFAELVYEAERGLKAPKQSPARNRAYRIMASLYLGVAVLLAGIIGTAIKIPALIASSPAPHAATVDPPKANPRAHLHNGARHSRIGNGTGGLY